VARREEEIARLGAQAAQGKDIDTAALQYRSEAQESIILQLNEQVDTLPPDKHLVHVLASW
jgi:hypothetical protein